jgi:hypothetical protein
MLDPESSSDSSSDSNSTLGNMEIDRDEPDGAQPAAHSKGEGDGFATLDSDFMGSDSDGLDEPRPKDPDDDHGAKSSFANSLAKTLNTAFAGAPPRSHSVQHTVNPLQLTLQSTGSSSLHNSPNLDFDPIDTDPAGARSDSESSSDSSSDSDSTLDNMEIDRDEPDGVRPAANAQGNADPEGARSDSESSSDSSLDSDSTLDNMEIDRDEPDGVRPTANARTGKLTARSPLIGALFS